MRTFTALTILTILSIHTLQAQTTNPYRILKDVPGVYPETGGYMKFWYQIATDKDSVFENQFTSPEPVGMPVLEVTGRPSLQEGMMLLTAGDSARFTFRADSFYLITLQGKLPEFLRPESFIHLTLKIDAVYTKAYVDSAMASRRTTSQDDIILQQQTYLKDSLDIQDYLKKHHLTGIRTPSGTYVVLLKKNKKAERFVMPEDTVKASYVGTLLIGGQEFDRSKTGEPFVFVVGIGQVINGWEEGLLKLKRREKALLLIPSRNAYGTRGAGSEIPPNAALIFEVELF